MIDTQYPEKVFTKHTSLSKEKLKSSEDYAKLIEYIKGCYTSPTPMIVS